MGPYTTSIEYNILMLIGYIILLTSEVVLSMNIKYCIVIVIFIHQNWIGYKNTNFKTIRTEFSIYGGRDPAKLDACGQGRGVKS